MSPSPHPRLFAPSWLPAVCAICGLVAQAADPRHEPPARGPQRSHIQSVGEIAATAPRHEDALGLRLSRASTVLRQQLALTRGAGLVVEDVTPGSRAARAGFKQHDVLVMLDDQLLLLPEQLAALVEAAPVDTPMACTVLRGGRKVQLPLGSAGPSGVATAAPSTGLRATESALAIVREAGGISRPAAGRREPSAAAPARLRRLAAETLLRQDADYHIRLTGGEETRLVVTDTQGRVVFDDAIDSPEARSRMPVTVRQRVEEMERSLERRPARPAAEIGRLDVAPIEVR
ncbi:MAG: hypothetical protein ACKONH_05010 [Planctomycetia bacterium]